MAIEKRFIHFKKFSDFNSKKLSANEANTQYTIGISGAIQDGSPDVLYQSYVWIKDTKQQWTHGQLYDGTDSGAKVYTWNWDGSDSGTLTQEEYDGIKEADVVYVSIDGQPALVRKGYSSSDIQLAVMQILDLSEYNSGTWVIQNTFTINSDKTYSVKYTNVSIPTKTSQIENDSDFVSSSNLKTINGESILGEGDLTVESGAKVYTWNYYSDSESVTLSQEEYDNIVEADIVVVNFGGIMSITVNKSGKEFGEAMGEYMLTGQFESQGSKMYINILINISTKLATVTVEEQEIPTKTSQLENNSNFVTSYNIKTINGESILGSGDITIEGETLTESDIAAMGFTKNTGTYSKPSGGIPKSDLSVDVQSALNAANAYQGTVTNITINGTTKTPVNGVVDLGNVGTYNKPSTGIPKSDLASEVQTSLGKADNSLQVETFGDMELITLNGFEGRGAGLLYALPHEATGDEDDVLASKNTLKTINGESLVGNGNISLPSEVTESTVSGWGFTKNAGTITGISANGTSVATSGVANIPAATTSKYGVTKLSSATNSTSTTLAATASAVKSAYDLANGRQEKLVSGTNIKTINNTSILGSGNITITTDANIQAVDTQETLDDVNTNTYVKYVAQTLTEEQKAQVRENIGVNDSAGSSSKQIITVESGAYLNFLGTNPMIPNAIYIVMGTINAFQLEDTGFVDDSWFATQYNNGDVYAEYTIIFTYTDDCYFMLPDYILWANGTFPTLEDGVRYELSIAFTILNNTNWIGQAVIVPFKAV